MTILHPNTSEYDELLNEKGVMLVDFYADWCGPCKMLAPVLEELATSYEDKMKVVKVNVDEYGDLAMRYAVTSIPTLLIFKDGELVKQQAGFQSLPQLKGLVDTYL